MEILHMRIRMRWRRFRPDCDIVFRLLRAWRGCYGLFNSFESFEASFTNDRLHSGSVNSTVVPCVHLKVRHLAQLVRGWRLLLKRRLRRKHVS